MYFGPVTASHYRIAGPHKWDRASSYIKGKQLEIRSIDILETFKRVHEGMNFRQPAIKGTPYRLLIFNNPAIILIVFVVFSIYWLKTLF